MAWSVRIREEGWSFRICIKPYSCYSITMLKPCECMTTYIDTHICLEFRWIEELPFVMNWRLTIWLYMKHDDDHHHPIWRRIVDQFPRVSQTSKHQLNTWKYQVLPSPNGKTGYRRIHTGFMNLDMLWVRLLDDSVPTVKFPHDPTHLAPAVSPRLAVEQQKISSLGKGERRYKSLLL